jgi:hypothetical protein
MMYCTCFLWLSIAFIASVFTGGPSPHVSPVLSAAQQKVSRIEADRWPPGGSISFSPQELTALGMADIESASPGAVTQPGLTLGSNTATATAVVDFDRLRQGSATHNGSGSWLYSQLLTGQHPISVSVDVRSSAGTMTIHPTAIAVSGVTLSGTGLQFLLKNVVRPRYPSVGIDRPFALTNHIERIEVNPGRAVVARKRRKSSSIHLRNGLLRQPDAIGNTYAFVGVADEK